MVVSIMRRLGKEILRLFHRQKGFNLLEVLVAVGILAAIGVVFMTSMTTANRSVGILDEQLQAEALVRSQLEKIKQAPYQESEDSGWYLSELIDDLPLQYSIDISVGYPSCIGTADNCTVLVTDPFTLQEITVTVYHEDKLVLSVACYKAKQQ